MQNNNNKTSRAFFINRDLISCKAGFQDGADEADISSVTTVSSRARMSMVKSY